MRTTPIERGRQTKRWAICTGAGASAETLKEVREKKIDTLIVGEGPHWTAVYAEETELAIIYAGHYATETFGVRAVGRELEQRFGVETTFVDVANPV